MNIALITAKGGNLSLKDKNLIEVEGRPLVGHAIFAARRAKKIGRLFLSTEDALIREAALAAGGCEIIDRPVQLAAPDTNHAEVIWHGAFAARERLKEDVGIVVILLGNTAMTRPEDIDRAVEALESDPSADSAMTVWKAQDDHPWRAMRLDGEGYLRSFGERASGDTNRQSYPEVFFYDQGPWAVRMSVLEATRANPEGPACWRWMGRRSIPLPRPWVTGRDVHDALDVAVARAFLRDNLWEV